MDVGDLSNHVKYFVSVCFPSYEQLSVYHRSDFPNTSSVAGLFIKIPFLVLFHPPFCLCSALPFIEPEHAKTSSPVNQSMSGIVGKRSWCRGLELPDFSLLNWSDPCETEGMVNSGIKTVSFRMKK